MRGNARMDDVILVAIISIAAAALYGADKYYLLVLSLTGIAAGTWVDALGGGGQSLSPELTNVAGAPLSLQLLFPRGSSCATPAQ